MAIGSRNKFTTVSRGNRLFPLFRDISDLRSTGMSKPEQHLSFAAEMISG